MKPGAKKFLKIVAILLILAAAGYGAMLAWVEHSYGPMTDEAKAFNEKLLTDFAQNWNWSVVAAHAHDKLKQATEGKDMTKMTDGLKNKFGALKSLSNSDCGITVNYDPEKQVFARCHADAAYEKENATVITTMQNINGNWEVMGIKF